MRFYCTHFDINYIAHARSLHDSLQLHNKSYRLFMFCMCDESYELLKRADLPNVQLVHFSELERFEPGLTTARANRSKVEYFYTCSPATCYYSLMNFKEVDIITYLDADLYFFSSPELLYTELDKSSIGIIEHRFGWLTRRNSVYGKYNVGWINFRNDPAGLSCVKDWMNDCINWCYQRLEDGKYADQKYLDTWPEKYKNVHIIKHKGANLAVWNISNYKITKKDQEILVDNEPLIFYHFANLKQIDDLLFKTDLSRVFVHTSGVIKNNIYFPYIKKLLSNKNPEVKIYAKKDAHISGIFAHIVNMTRKVREVLFPDLIEIN